MTGNPQAAPQRLQTRSELEQQTIHAVDVTIEATRRPRIGCYVDATVDRRDMSVVQSRIGGQYAWPENTPPPIAGAEAFCLIQVNLAQLPAEVWEASRLYLPRKGVLQVFVRPDSNYGCDFDNYRGTGFRIVLHQDIEHLKLSTPSSFQLQAERNAVLPLGTQAAAMLTTGYPIRFRYDASTTISSNDYRFTGPTLGILHDIQSNTMCSPQFEAWYDDRAAQLDSDGISLAWLFGHPHFCQEDVRFQYEEQQYEALVSFASDGNFFDWGDMGSATFLVDESDGLFDFSRALYSWDCY